jgi:hypothetical protein
MGKRVRSVEFKRSVAVIHLQRKLQAQSYPRIQMGLIVALTGASGLLWSYLLLHAGVHSMALRYPLVVAAAYGVFLGLLWAWLRTQAADYVEAGSNVMDGGSGGGGGGGGNLVFRTGGGGDFGGGGASASFDAPASPLSAAAESSGNSFGSEVGSELGEGVGKVLDGGDDIIVPLLVVLLAIGLAVASLYIVYMAPALFAELLFDGTLSVTLYKHLKKGDEPNWVVTALRKTALPFVLTAVFVGLVGGALGHYAPGARTISEALEGAGR